MSNEKYVVDYALLLTQLVDEIKGWDHPEKQIIWPHYSFLSQSNFDRLFPK
jgi:hypothetical protein